MLPRRTFVAAARASAFPAYAQAWPAKPIKLAVPCAAGGTTDVISRMMAEHLGPRLGQIVIVDNRPGKGAMVGTAPAAKAPPDRYYPDPDSYPLVRHLGAGQDAPADRRPAGERNAGGAEGASRGQAPGGDRRRGEHHDTARNDALRSVGDRQASAGGESFGSQAWIRRRQ